MSQIVYLLGGYARSGKTTALQYLESKGIPTLSTSKVLHEATARMLHSLFGMTGEPVEQYYKGIEDRKDTALVWGTTGREFKIKMAEEILVPTFGREVLVNAVAQKATPGCAIESIGGHEEQLLIEALTKRGFTTKAYNIVREGELEGVDIRQPLLNAETIENNDSKAELYRKLNAAFIYPRYDGGGTPNQGIVAGEALVIGA